MPRISVIVPIFNAERYLEKCLYSIIDQSFSDIEIICVNDKSSDHSAEIVNSLARNDARLRLFNHETNLGPGGARNTGITHARSNYLAFVDSDDYVDPNMLEEFLECSDNEKFDVVESGCRAIGEDGELIWEYTPEKKTFNSLEGNRDRMFLLREWGLPQKLWRKSLFADPHLTFPTHVYWEDISLIPILMQRANNLRKLDSIFYNYTQRKNSITNTASAKHVVDLFKAFEHIKKFLIDNGIYERERENFKKIVTNCTGYLATKMRGVDESGSNDVNRIIERCSVLAGTYLRHDDRFISFSEQEVIYAPRPDDTDNAKRLGAG